jgi:hypothetical protein
VTLLGDIKRIFESKEADKLPTIEILNAMVAIEDDRPWAAWWLDDLRRDQPQKPASRLARLLKPYGIKAHVIRIDDETPRGYERADFLEAWKRNLPNPSASLPEAATSATSATHHRGNVAAVAAVAPFQGERQKELDAMSDAEFEAWFGKTKAVYPGEWIRLRPDETDPDWLSTLRQALAEPCEVCGDQMGNEPYLWFHRTRHVARCRDCQESDWWADGYEIDGWGMPSCWSWRHTREERIAERDRNTRQKLAKLERRVQEQRRNQAEKAEAKTLML